MRSVRRTLVIWYVLTALGVWILLVFFTLLRLSFLNGVDPGVLRAELTKGWILLGLPVLLLTSFIAWTLARQLIAPWENLAQQIADFLNADAKTNFSVQRFPEEYKSVISQISNLADNRQQTRRQFNQFSAKVAHELRGPITLLQLQIDFAAPNLELELADNLRTQIRRLTEYVETALIVARAEKGTIPIHRQKILISEFTAELLKPYRLRAETYRRKMQIRLHSKKVVEIDPKIVGLISNNLLANAFIHGSGDIRVHSRREWLTITNRVRQGTDPADPHSSIGMGLRTVAVLAEAHGNLSVRTRKLGRTFAASIRFITV
ncbi:MAG: hypothetical protein JOY96_06525 [Verrucomicrobia bacterium]|nr:hypothetical protein [Verrucomicrobiota bacterium]MBV9671202.1 hypothetical protein [Verrucomicrobiota bacterium]